MFRDLNGDGTLDPGDPTLAGVTVFIDENGTGTLAAGDPTTQTDANGRYTLLERGPGTEDVFVVAPSGFFTPGTTAQVPPGGTAAAVDAPVYTLPSPSPSPTPTPAPPSPSPTPTPAPPSPRLRQHRRFLALAYANTGACRPGHHRPVGHREGQEEEATGGRSVLRRHGAKKNAR